MRRFALCAFFLLFWSPLTAKAPQSQNYYIISAREDNPGLFSIFNTVLGCLDQYEKTGARGVTLNFKDKGLYYDKKKGKNWWSYYFKPLKLGKKRKGASTKVFSTDEMFALSQFATRKMSRERGRELIRRYIRLQPRIKKKVKAFYKKKLKGKFVIGLHYRGTDKGREAPKVAYEEVCRQIDQAIQTVRKRRFRIFVATDEAALLRLLKKRYPRKIAAIKAIRSRDGKPVHIFSNRSNYKKGEDAVLDCLLLSKCNVIIKMASNLSDVSLKFNPHVPVIHLNQNYT